MEVGFSNGVAGIDSVPEIVGVLGTAWNAFVRALGDMGVTEGVIVLNQFHFNKILKNLSARQTALT